MKNINRLLLMVAALVGMQSIANAAAAATPLDTFKKALLEYEQALIKGKKINALEHFDLLDRALNIWGSSNDQEASAMAKFAQSKGLSVDGLNKRFKKLAPLAQKVKADQAAAASGDDAARQAAIARLAADMQAAQQVIDQSAAESMPGSPRGSLINASPAPSEAGDIAAAAGNAGVSGQASADVKRRAEPKTAAERQAQIDRALAELESRRAALPAAGAAKRGAEYDEVHAVNDDDDAASEASLSAGVGAAAAGTGIVGASGISTTVRQPAGVSAAAPAASQRDVKQSAAGEALTQQQSAKIVADTLVAIDKVFTWILGMNNWTAAQAATFAKVNKDDNFENHLKETLAKVIQAGNSVVEPVKVAMDKSFDEKVDLIDKNVTNLVTQMSRLTAMNDQYYSLSDRLSAINYATSKLLSELLKANVIDHDEFMKYTDKLQAAQNAKRAQFDRLLKSSAAN